MLRSAEEILNSVKDNNPFPVRRISIEMILEAIRTAQREAIRECAEFATVYLPSHPHLHGTKNIDKQSILNLLEQVK